MQEYRKRDDFDGKAMLSDSGMACEDNTIV
jgi:hypothetical protein